MTHRGRFQPLPCWNSVKTQQEFVNFGTRRSLGVFSSWSTVSSAALPRLLVEEVSLRHFLERFHSKWNSKPAIFMLFIFVPSGKPEIGNSARNSARSRPAPEDLVSCLHDLPVNQAC